MFFFLFLVFVKTKLKKIKQSQQRDVNEHVSIVKTKKKSKYTHNIMSMKRKNISYFHFFVLFFFTDFGCSYLKMFSLSHSLFFLIFKNKIFVEKSNFEKYSKLLQRLYSCTWYEFSSEFIRILLSSKENFEWKCPLILLQTRAQSCSLHFFFLLKSFCMKTK